MIWKPSGGLPGGVVGADLVGRVGLVGSVGGFGLAGWVGVMWGVVGCGGLVRVKIGGLGLNR